MNNVSISYDLQVVVKRYFYFDVLYPKGEMIRIIIVEVCDARMLNKEQMLTT
jgi:hypothetical protein